MLLRQDQFAVLDRDLLSWIVAQVNGLLFAFEQVLHVEARGFLACVVLRFAHALRLLISVAILHSFLDAVTRIPTCSSAADPRDVLPPAIANLVADHATDDRTDD